MTVVGVDNNLYASSSQNTVTNILPKPRKTTPDFWYPSRYDRSPELRLGLPELYGLMPEQYDVMSIDIKAVNFKRVTVKVTNSANQVVFTVSFYRVINHIFTCSVFSNSKVFNF